MSDGIVNSLGDTGESLPFHPNALRTALASVLGSPAFDVPARARKFLEYVVEETICGRAGRIKAYTIAVEVFGREASFDAQADPIVRIEAGRIRRALAHYYLTAGALDPIHITIPKGTYVPVFVGEPGSARPASLDPSDTNRQDLDRSDSFSPAMTRTEWSRLVNAVETLAEQVGSRPSGRSTPSPSSVIQKVSDELAPRLPRLVVAKFEALNGTNESQLLARGLVEEISCQLSKFKEFTVLRNHKDEKNSSADADTSTYELQGCVFADSSSVHLAVKLSDVKNNLIVWASAYDEHITANSMMDTITSIATEISTGIGQSHGAIFQAESGLILTTAPVHWDAYQSTLSYYVYQDDVTSEGHAAVRASLERTVDRFPTYATAWALLSLVYIDEMRFSYPALSSRPPALQAALEMARRAIRLDSRNVRGMEAEMLALFLTGEIEAALDVGAKALTINPNDKHLQAEYGLRLALSGEWAKGAELMVEALARNPGHLTFQRCQVGLCHYMLGDYDTARIFIIKSDALNNPVAHFVAAAVYGQLGDHNAAAYERIWIERNAPSWLGSLGQAAALRISRKQDQQHFLEGLSKAGFSFDVVS
jgi:TolB-like protein